MSGGFKQLTTVLRQQVGGTLRSNVMLSVSIMVVFGMGSSWRSCSWPSIS